MTTMENDKHVKAILTENINFTFTTNISYYFKDPFFNSRHVNTILQKQTKETPHENLPIPLKVAMTYHDQIWCAGFVRIFWE